MFQPHITIKPAEQLTEAESKAYAGLSKIVWPHNPDVTPPEIAPEDAASRPGRIVAFIEKEGAIVSEAEGFARVIVPENGAPMRILALASVCTHPDHRHKGLSQKAVKAVLKRVDDGEFPVALWHTGVPEFYEKMGARIVGNRFTNSRHPTDPEKCPFWDKFVMIYPSNANWPDSGIDLNGLGY